MLKTVYTYHDHPSKAFSFSCLPEQSSAYVQQRMSYPSRPQTFSCLIQVSEECPVSLVLSSDQSPPSVSHPSGVDVGDVSVSLPPSSQVCCRSSHDSYDEFYPIHKDKPCCCLPKPQYVQRPVHSDQPVDGLVDVSLDNLHSKVLNLALLILPCSLSTQEDRVATLFLCFLWRCIS